MHGVQPIIQLVSAQLQPLQIHDADKLTFDPAPVARVALVLFMTGLQTTPSIFDALPNIFRLLLHRRNKVPLRRRRGNETSENDKCTHLGTRVEREKRKKNSEKEKEGKRRNTRSETPTRPALRRTTRKTRRYYYAPLFDENYGQGLKVENRDLFDGARGIM